jgi:hypothetical protein
MNAGVSEETIETTHEEVSVTSEDRLKEATTVEELGTIYKSLSSTEQKRLKDFTTDLKSQLTPVEAEVINEPVTTE